MVVTSNFDLSQNPLYAYKATSSPYTLYLYQAVKTKIVLNSEFPCKRKLTAEWKVKTSLSSKRHKSLGQPQYSQQSGNSNRRETYVGLVAFLD